MDDIKLAVVQTLEKQGILAQLKAQLRAQVFLAVEEYDSASLGLGLASKTDASARKALLSDGDGQIAIQLVLDLLDTCNFVFTKKVFQPELGSKPPEGGRQAAAQSLGLKPSFPEEPLLITLLKAYKAGSSVQAVNISTPSSGPSALPRPGDSSVAATTAPTPATVFGSQPSMASAPSSKSAPAVPSRATAPIAPLPRMEALDKPSLGPLPQLGTPATKQTEFPPAPAASKPQPSEPSALDIGYDDDFEDVEEDVEDDVDAVPALDEDEDIAAALGCTTITGTSSKGAADLGKERLGGPMGSIRGRTALDPDLMIGDRSCGVSQELAGLDAGNSGGLSYSTDFPGGDTRASLSSSQAMLSPIFEGSAKLAKLEPLRPTGSSKLAPLAPLAPLPSISSSLSSSREDPLGTKGGPKPLAPLGALVRKSMVDIEKEKEELRRLGLLQSSDSLNNSVEVESRPRPVGARPSIYDAEMSVIESMDEGNWPTGRDDKQQVFGKIKGVSMDLGATGLSASDRSGDIEHLGVDFAETAEWH